MVVLSYSVIYYIYIPGTLGPCFHYWCSVYGICKWSDTLWSVGRVRLFADYTISLSSLCRLIWKHWTTKMLVRYMMPSVSKIKTILSIIFIFTIWGCVSSAYPILLWWSRECVLYLIIIKPEVWIINHCLGLGHETMVCAVCLTMFFPYAVFWCILSPRYTGLRPSCHLWATKTMTKSPKPRILCNCHIMTLVPSWTTKTGVVAQQVAQRRKSGGRTVGMVAQGLNRSLNGGRVVATVIAQWTLLVGQMRHNGCTRKAGARRPNWYTLFTPIGIFQYFKQYEFLRSILNAKRNIRPTSSWFETEYSLSYV